MENLEIKNGQSVLEIGTGTGIVAMYASKLTDKVTATDINFDAITLAESNFKANNIDMGNAIYASSMFQNCSKLKSVKIKNVIKT